MVRIVDKTLLEQMLLTDREIDKRKSLFDLSHADVRVLRELKPTILENLDWAIEEFYARQIDDIEISVIIGDAETLRRLKGAMRKYIIELFSGQYDHDYVNSRLRVGKVHWRIGVTPKLFLSALRRLFIILGNIIEETAETSENLKEQKDAVLKILFFDSQLVFDTYINGLHSEVEAARQETRAYAASLEEQVEERTQQLEELSRTDGLTGVYNHRAFKEHLRRTLAAAQRALHPVSLLFADLDNFKHLNDTQGHGAGDEQLCRVAHVLSSSVRVDDIVCRIGGDEFCVIMAAADEGEAQIVADRFLNALAGDSRGVSTVSIGFATTGPTEFCELEDLMARADRSMYEAKKAQKSSARGVFPGRIQEAS